MNVMDSVYESEDEPMCTDMLKGVRDGSKSRLSINRRESCCKIYDPIRGIQTEWKVELLYTLNMGKGLHKVFKSAVNEISQVLPIFG